MTALTIVLIVAGVMAGTGLLAVVAWFGYTSYLNRVERRLARRKGVYRQLVAELRTRERALLEPELHRLGTLLDLEALEAVLEEQARATAERPAWLLDVYDRLGLVDRYVERLRTARRWRERAFAAELLGRVGNAKAVPALLETAQATRTEDGDVREIALRALARIADPRAVAPLIESLGTADAWLAPRIADILTRHGTLVVDPLIEFLEQPGRHPARPWAANVLGEVRAARAFAALARGLGDEEDEVRAKCATALGRLGDRRAIAYLLEHLLTDPAPFVRARIAGTLGQFDDPEVIDQLVRSLGDPAWWVRMRSVEALERIGARAEGPLLVALDDPDPEIRIRAAVGLERLGVPATLVGMIQRGERLPEAMETLVKVAGAAARELLAELLLHPAEAVRTAVVGAIRRAARADLAPELIETARRDAEPTVRATAFEALAALGAREAVTPALVGLADPEPGVRAAAGRALGQLRAIDAAPDLLRLLGDADPAVRCAAADGLGRLADPAAVPALLRTFENADPALRGSIVEAVSLLDPGAVGGLIERLVADRDTAGKVGAIHTLGRLRSPAAAGALDRLWQDSEPAVRAAALDAAGQLQLVDQGPGVLRLLQQDPSPLVRERAALAAGLLRVPGGEAALLAVCHRPEPLAVRAAAALAVGAFERESIVARVAEMPDAAAVRSHLRDRLQDDAGYRLLGRMLPPARHVEVRALGAETGAGAEVALAEGLHSSLGAGERIRLIGGLRAYQGEQSRGALLAVVRGDPSPEVRTAALTAVASLLDDDDLLAVARRALGDPSLLVRRAAVGLFARIAPERGLPSLLQTLRPGDDPAVLASVAELTEGAFDTFVELTLAMPPDGQEAVLAAQVARYVHHRQLPRLLPVLARSGSPAAREAVAALWRHRPDVVDPVALAALTLDPVVAVRREAAGAAVGGGCWDLVARMAEDPDPEVRRAVAVAVGGADRPDRAALETLARLADDPAMSVRAAAYVGRLLQGTPVPLPPGLDLAVAAGAVEGAADLRVLRQAARAAPREDRRLAAALALALLGDPAARDVARTDPIPAIRHRVGGALELADAARGAG